LRTKSRLCR